MTLLASGPLVTGTVTDHSNSQPIANAAISVSRNPMSTFRGGATTVSINTANDGPYSIDVSYFAESPRNVSISTIPETENFALTPGAAAP